MKEEDLWNITAFQAFSPPAVHRLQEENFFLKYKSCKIRGYVISLGHEKEAIIVWKKTRIVLGHLAK